MESMRGKVKERRSERLRGHIVKEHVDNGQDLRFVTGFFIAV